MSGSLASADSGVAPTESSPAGIRGVAWFGTLISHGVLGTTMSSALPLAGVHSLAAAGAVTLPLHGTGARTEFLEVLLGVVAALAVYVVLMALMHRANSH